MLTIPLIIDNEDILLEGRREPVNVCTGPKTFQGATKEIALKAADSSARAFESWSRTSPAERRASLLRLAEVARSRAAELEQLAQDEVQAEPFWAHLTMQDAIGLIEDCAGKTSPTGSVPTMEGGAYGLVMKEPLGVVLGIAPWNVPIFLSLRAIIAPIAVGNTVVLKGSELSPRVHYTIASLFRDAGFPPGVVNLLLHRPSDAAEIFDTLITHPAIKKCNFTGSTGVGRIVASQAAMALKPVLLELGGKNYTIVLDDANLDLAAEQILRGAFLNNGQICMSTDLVLATKTVSKCLEAKMQALLQHVGRRTVITPAARSRLDRLVEDAERKGAKAYTAPRAETDSLSAREFMPTVLTGVTSEMEFFHTEAFGPMVGIVAVDAEEDIFKLADRARYGLSAAIISSNHLRALQLSRRLKTGAVHINFMTVYDDNALPHGGRGESGWGRFGSHWGVEEFIQTKSIVLHA
ncbi:hypothetical protein ASPZODRAFT_16049 [Penicilliopsis zonata CBS 506.65]|uniref:Aldehyde dehydrogenase domain-containing protein n=1 Tax=Penicilliopsis zonata CBS 506.65 TaxID=1073090 RepID=A0A1L9SJJ6_9EURO|nr:hypothetical protein ASPZODRAFT_16049 [Penicilliopsis zonata CBS 506.65]OJJ47368.1 hypothetical protein ASPZODRAFT_16049 [Penicilliopsis zonata CBS 506.65]